MLWVLTIQQVFWRIMQHLDIIVFAIVAVVIALRLRAVLGQRHEGEPRRPNPFGVPQAGKEEDDEGFMLSPKQDALPDSAAQSALPSSALLAPESLAGGLALVQRQWPDFEEKAFLQGARAAFSLIVGHYAAGEAEQLKRYLGPDVHAAFAKAIALRQAAGQKLATTIHTIKEAEIVRARVTGEVARLTVRFVSEQSNVTSDASGQVVEGSPTAREEIEDVWSFARPLKQTDPIWLLVETRV
jgi:predicted lipid-binding transport protein (Tim44 family)